jgi:tellurite resistance protein TerC
VYVFGALLIWSGLRLLRRGANSGPEASPALRFLRRILPTTRRLIGPRLLVRATCPRPIGRRAARCSGRWYATPLLAVLVAIEAADIVSAVDSIPAIFGVTREPFIVFSATAFALLGLRSLYFVLAGVRARFHYLDTGLAVILGFVGVKFLLTDVVEIDPAGSLAVIVGVLTTAIATSLTVMTAGPRRRSGARGGSRPTTRGRGRRARRSASGSRSCRRPAPGSRR